MNRYKINILLLSAIIGFAYAKDSYTISGSVQNESGEAIKKGSVVLVNKTDGAEIKKTKISRKGKFKLKKIATGKYQINVHTIKIINNTYHCNIIVNDAAVLQGHSTNITHDTINTTVTIPLKRGDWVKIQGGWHGSDVYSSYEITRIN